MTRAWRIASSFELSDPGRQWFLLLTRMTGKRRRFGAGESSFVVFVASEVMPDITAAAGAGRSTATTQHA